MLFVRPAENDLEATVAPELNMNEQSDLIMNNLNSALGYI